MANETPSVETLKKLLEIETKRNEELRKSTELKKENTIQEKKGLDESLKSLDVYKNFQNALANIGNLHKKLNEELGKGSKNIKDMDQNAKILLNSLGKMGLVTFKTNVFDNFVASSEVAFSSISDHYESLKQKLGDVSGWGSKLASSIGVGALTSMIPGFDAISGKLGELKGVIDGMAGTYLSNLTQVQKLESGFLNLASSTGELRDVYEQSGSNLKNLDALTSNFASILIQTRNQTNLSSSQINEYASKLGKIPGVLGSIITVSAGYPQIDGFTAALRLAAGAGRGVSDVSDSLKIAVEKLGNAQGQVNDRTEKGIKLFSMMYELTNKKLGLTFEETKGYLNDVADQFEFVGDNTEAAAKTLNNFIGGLKNTGLTAKSSMEIVKGMNKSVNDLSIGTKAFLSLRSGGPGGLMGAFQIDMLRREGKTDEIIKMITVNLQKQFGGRIYSLEEAAKSPVAAAQFYRQREMLRSGAFGGLAKTEDQATRLLEAISKGEANEQLLNSMDVTKEILNKGEEYQKRSFNEFKAMNDALDDSNTFQAIQAYNSTRLIAGARADEVFKKAATASIDLRRKAVGSPEEEYQSGLFKTQLNIVESGKGIINTVSKISEAISGSMSETINASKALITQPTAPKVAVLKTEPKAIESIMPKFDSSVNNFSESSKIFSNAVSNMSSKQSIAPDVAKVVEKTSARPSTEPITINLKISSPDGITVSNESGTSFGTGVVKVNFTNDPGY